MAYRRTVQHRVKSPTRDAQCLFWTRRNRASITPALCYGPLSRGSGAQVAQLVEHVTENHGVGGSIPPLGTIVLSLGVALILQDKPPPSLSSMIGRPTGARLRHTWSSVRARRREVVMQFCSSHTGRDDWRL